MRERYQSQPRAPIAARALQLSGNSEACANEAQAGALSTHEATTRAHIPPEQGSVSLREQSGMKARACAFTCEQVRARDDVHRSSSRGSCRGWGWVCRCKYGGLQTSTRVTSMRLRPMHYACRV